MTVNNSETLPDITYNISQASNDDKKELPIQPDNGDTDNTDG